MNRIECSCLVELLSANRMYSGIQCILLYSGNFCSFVSINSMHE